MSVKVLIAKPGLDGHDRGAKVVARALRDSGMEVVYLGIRNPPQRIVQSAIQEDVDVIGLSSLSGAHMHHFKEVMKLLKEKRAEDIAVIGGGIIPDKDVEELKSLGVQEVFGPGTPLDEIVSHIRRLGKGRKN